MKLKGYGPGFKEFEAKSIPVRKTTAKTRKTTTRTTTMITTTMTTTKTMKQVNQTQNLMQAK